MSVTLATEDDSAAGLLTLGIAPEDITCPICVETIADPFVTSCGHTFCYKCITTHLKNKNTCPSCSAYITQDHIYPNFLLNKMLRKIAAAAPASGNGSLLERVRQAVNDASRRLCAPDIDGVLELLYDKREDLERRESSDVLHLLLCFLRHAREQKEGRLRELRQQLAVLDSDLSSIAGGRMGTAPALQQNGADLGAGPSTSAAAGGPVRQPSIHFHTISANQLNSITINPNQLSSGQQAAALNAAMQHMLAAAGGASSSGAAAAAGGSSSALHLHPAAAQQQQQQQQLQYGLMAGSSGVMMANGSSVAITQLDPSVQGAGLPRPGSYGHLPSMAVAGNGSSGNLQQLATFSMPRGSSSGNALELQQQHAAALQRTAAVAHGQAGAGPSDTMHAGMVGSALPYTVLYPVVQAPQDGPGAPANGRNAATQQAAALMPGAYAAAAAHVTHHLSPYVYYAAVPAAVHAGQQLQPAVPAHAVWPAGAHTTPFITVRAPPQPPQTAALCTGAAAGAPAPRRGHATSAHGSVGHSHTTTTTTGSNSSGHADAGEEPDSDSSAAGSGGSESSAPQASTAAAAAAGAVALVGAAAAAGVAAGPPPSGATTAGATAPTLGGPPIFLAPGATGPMFLTAYGPNPVPVACTAPMVLSDGARPTTAPTPQPRALAPAALAAPHPSGGGGGGGGGYDDDGYDVMDTGRATKWRRMLSQYDVLEQCYLQMRVRTTSGTGESLPAPPPPHGHRMSAAGNTASLANAAAGPSGGGGPYAAAPSAAATHAGAGGFASFAAVAGGGGGAAAALGGGGPQYGRRLGAVDTAGPAEAAAELSSFGEMLAAATLYSRVSLVAEVPKSAAQSSAVGRAGSNILSSIEFDMEDGIFATAGVVPRILLYDYNALAAAPQGRPGPHHPVLELTARAKLSCLSFSAADRSKLLASDYDGLVTLWDTATGMQAQDFEAHEKRVWGVDFSLLQHDRFATGSDDNTVKVWSLHQENAAQTMELSANVCSVKYNPTDPNLLAVGCADHRAYVYDLRRHGEPLYKLQGHRKAVSYVRWLNGGELVSASTDSTLKLWAIPGTPARQPPPLSGDSGAAAYGSSTAAGAGGGAELVRTYAGHVNEKNFVGLSTDGEFIACGSENHAVHVYYKAIPRPTMSYSFNGAARPGTAGGGQGGSQSGTPAASGSTAGGGHFVTAVTWRRNSPDLVVANSGGNIWLLRLQA